MRRNLGGWDGLWAGRGGGHPAPSSIKIAMIEYYLINVYIVTVLQQLPSDSDDSNVLVRRLLLVLLLGVSISISISIISYLLICSSVHMKMPIT